MSVSRKKGQISLNDGSIIYYEIELENGQVGSTTLNVHHHYNFTESGEGALDAFESLLCSLLFSKVYLKRANVVEGINAAWEGIVDRHKCR